MADEKKYYVFCADNCKYEAMTKEQVIAAIAEATGNTPTDIDSAFITKIKEINKGAAVQIWLGTTAEYNALAEIADNVIYIKTDDTRITDLENALAENTEALQSSINSNIRHVFSVQWNRVTNEITAESEDYLTNLYNAIRNGENVEIRATDNSGYIHLLTVSDISRVFLSAVDPRNGYIYSWRVGEGYISYWGKGLVTAEDVVIETGTDQNFTYQKYASAKIEAWHKCDLLITEATEVTAPAGLKKIVGKAYLPSFVSGRISVINIGLQDSFLIGSNYQIDGTSLTVTMYGLSAEMENIGVASVINVDINLICNNL